MICPKRKYDKKGAQTLLNKLKRKHREEKRIYHCPICKYWHLTSKEYDRTSSSDSDDSAIYTFNNMGWNDLLKGQGSD